MKQPTNIIFSGIGGIGGYYGGCVAKLTEEMESYNTQFFMREGDHLNKVRKIGLEVETPGKQFITKPSLATADPQDLPLADYLFLNTKSYDLEYNINQLQPCITDQTIIIPTHNGLDVPPRIRKILPNNFIAPACCYITVRRDAPGHIFVRSDRNGIFFGASEKLMNRKPTDEEVRKLEILYLIMKAADTNVRLETDVDHLLRKKFIMLSPSAAATAYFNHPIGIIQDEHGNDLFQLVKELASIYATEGTEVAPDFAEQAYEEIKLMPREATTSMHSDILAGHTSELESLVGYVVRRATELGIEVPLYTKIYETLKGK